MSVQVAKYPDSLAAGGCTSCDSRGPVYEIRCRSSNVVITLRLCPDCAKRVADGLPRFTASERVAASFADREAAMWAERHGDQ